MQQTRAHKVNAGVHAVLQVVILLHWYSVKSQHEGLKGLNLMKVPMGQWGAFFLCVFLGQVQALANFDIDQQHVDHLKYSFVAPVALQGASFSLPGKQ